MVWIVDESNDGAFRSVTNDADVVVPEVLRLYPGHRIIYKDTEGRWDELVHEHGRFTGFKAGQATAPDLYGGPK